MQWVLVAAGALALALALSAANLPPERKLLQHNGTTSSAVGLRGYQRYHANDSLIGQPVECSHQEKICFRFNMLYDETNGCVRFGHYDAEFSSSHLVPVLFKNYDIVCDGYVMAFDDRCYRKEVVHDVICGCAAKPTRHFLNGVECRCVPPVPIHLEQPKEEGKCLIPDLRFPDKDRSFYYQNPYESIQGFTSNERPVLESKLVSHFNCSSEQLQCFAQGKVWLGEAKTCTPLLERGPCSEEHVVALDVQAALKGNVEATCVHVRDGCPSGNVRMPFDGNCHNKKDIELILGGKVFRNQFGIPLSVSGGIISMTFRPLQYKEIEPPACALMIERIPEVFYYEVGVNTYQFSKRFEVENTPPKPES